MDTEAGRVIGDANVVETAGTFGYAENGHAPNGLGGAQAAGAINSAATTASSEDMPQ